jgi:hypothetical protein
MSKLMEAADSLRHERATLIVLDCMGFTARQKAVVRDEARCPILLPASLVGKFLDEVI